MYSSEASNFIWAVVWNYAFWCDYLLFSKMFVVFIKSQEWCFLFPFYIISWLTLKCFLFLCYATNYSFPCFEVDYCLVPQLSNELLGSISQYKRPNHLPAAQSITVNYIPVITTEREFSKFLCVKSVTRVTSKFRNKVGL